MLPSICYPKSTLSSNVPKRFVLRLGRIYDLDEKFDIRSDEYQNYLIARDNSISVVKKQVHVVRNISRSEARQAKRKVTKKSLNLVTVQNYYT